MSEILDTPLLLELSVTESGIQTNVDMIVTAVTEKLKKYNYIVDDGNARQAKDDVAQLRKIAKQSQSERNRIKKKLLNAFEDPNQKLLTLEKLLNSTAQTLADGVEQVDKKRKDLLYGRYKEFWDKLAVGRYPFEIAFDPKYLNKTAKKAEVEQDLKVKHDGLDDGLEMVRKALPDVQSVDGVMVIQDYCNTGDLTSALKRAEQIRNIKEEQERRRAEEEARKQQAQQYQPPVEPKYIPDPHPLDAPIPGDRLEMINQTEPVNVADPIITSRWIVTAPQSVCRQAFDTLRSMGCLIQVER